MRKWSLLEQSGADKTAISDVLKDFLDRFPGDLRVRRVSLVMESMMKIKDKKDSNGKEPQGGKGN
ncbi:MAG: hypothetical protein HQM09_19880 [Candidatus Riflebacteria bacterium]|nr:hypothetical protein [Candidatus Riflebacteria bacterium]